MDGRKRSFSKTLKSKVVDELLSTGVINFGHFFRCSLSNVKSLNSAFCEFSTLIFELIAVFFAEDNSEIQGLSRSS